MRNVIVNEFMTLDGVAQAPGAADEDTATRVRARRLASEVTTTGAILATYAPADA